MTIDEVELKELLDFSVGLAREAGDLTLRHFRQDITVNRKNDGSFVTEVDYQTENLMRSLIKQNYPNDGIFGEEAGEELGSSGRRWIIDPIDGTYSFVHGVPLYGVLIGLEIMGECLVGVANIPALNDLVYAARGLGCFWNDQPTQVTSVASLNEALLLATDFNACDKYGFGAATKELQSKVAVCRTWGDCYGHILVATGRAEIMLDAVVKVWDCAALMPIIEEAGGTFTDWQGARTISGGNAISTNGKLFNQVQEIISRFS